MLADCTSRLEPAAVSALDMLASHHFRAPKLQTDTALPLTVVEHAERFRKHEARSDSPDERHRDRHARRFDVAEGDCPPRARRGWIAIISNSVDVLNVRRPSISFLAMDLGKKTVAGGSEAASSKA
jgi:hypothetical protein